MTRRVRVLIPAHAAAALATLEDLGGARVRFHSVATRLASERGFSTEMTWRALQQLIGLGRASFRLSDDGLETIWTVTPWSMRVAAAPPAVGAP